MALERQLHLLAISFISSKKLPLSVEMARKVYKLSENEARVKRRKDFHIKRYIEPNTDQWHVVSIISAKLEGREKNRM